MGILRFFGDVCITSVRKGNISGGIHCWENGNANVREGTKKQTQVLTVITHRKVSEDLLKHRRWQESKEADGKVGKGP